MGRKRPEESDRPVHGPGRKTKKQNPPQLELPKHLVSDSAEQGKFGRHSDLSVRT